MAPEGMVHALELLHELLTPRGRLVDIHPNGEEPPIELVTRARRWLAGNLQETDDFIEYAQAGAALAQAVMTGWFRIEQDNVFQFTVRASTMAELRDYIEQNWKDAILDPEIDQKIGELLCLLETEETVEENCVELRDFVRITRYQSQGPFARG